MKLWRRGSGEAGRVGAVHPLTIISTSSPPPSRTEFIHLVASEANEVSERQQKKVITPEHVIEALMTLGFQEYVEDVKTVHKEYKEQASVRDIHDHT